jgi:hypothetical protein
VGSSSGWVARGEDYADVFEEGRRWQWVAVAVAVAGGT